MRNKIVNNQSDDLPKTDKINAYKCIDDLGRLVLPIEIRRYLNITKNSCLNISLNGQTICIDKILKNCICCGRQVDEREDKNYNFIDNICTKCIEEIGIYNDEFIKQK